MVTRIYNNNNKKKKIDSNKYIYFYGLSRCGLGYKIGADWINISIFITIKFGEN